MRDALFLSPKLKKEVKHMAKYDVTITETLRMTVEVDAENRFDAEQMVSDNWRNSGYVLDEGHLQGVSFEARLQQKSRNQEC